MNYYCISGVPQALPEPHSVIAAVALAVSHYNGHKYRSGEPAKPTRDTINELKAIVERSVAHVAADVRYHVNMSLLQIEVYLPRVTGGQCLTLICSNSNSN